MQMRRTKYALEFKDEAVRQVIDRGHPVVDVANAALAFVTHVQLEEVDARLPGQDLAVYGLQKCQADSER